MISISFSIHTTATYTILHLHTHGAFTTQLHFFFTANTFFLRFLSTFWALFSMHFFHMYLCVCYSQSPTTIIHKSHTRKTGAYDRIRKSLRHAASTSVAVVAEFGNRGASLNIHSKKAYTSHSQSLTNTHTHTLISLT